MRKLKFVVLLAALMTVGVDKSYAHDIEVANADGVTIYYNFINNQTELEVTYQGSDYYYSRAYTGNVVIPESVTYEGNVYPVTSIGYYAFFFCSDLTEVTIPNSVTAIGGAAFERCTSLTEVSIPNSVTVIGGAAFWGCSSLTEVTIGNSVTSIGDRAFSYCDDLAKITVESGNSIFESRENCNALIRTNSNKLIAGCKTTVIPNSVTSIGESAFSGCSGLIEVTIPGNVTSIGGWAFSGCTGLTELTIGNGVTTIGNYAFEGCWDLTELTIPNSVTYISVQNPFADCGGLEKITVESGNPNYDSRENCNAIIETKSNKLIAGFNSTIIPYSVTAIGNYAFSYCRNLTELTIANSVTVIGNYAFEGCESLTELTIPDCVTSIGSRAFEGCSGLTTLYSLNTTPPKTYIPTFDNDHYTTVDIFVPAEALEAYQNAEVWKEFKKLQGFDAAAVEQVSTAAEQIQSANGQITVTGLTDGTTVTVYTLSGQQVGTATSTGGQATVSTSLTTGTATIVKMGDNKSVKVAVK